MAATLSHPQQPVAPCRPAGLTGSGLHPGRAFLRRHEAAVKRHMAGEGCLGQLQLLQVWAGAGP